MEKKISLSEYFGKNIFIRNSLSSFFDQINKASNQEIVLNFKNIDFISRSCADEYLKQKAKTGKKITEIDVSTEISSMLEIVEKQYKKTNFEVIYEKTPSPRMIYA